MKTRHDQNSKLAGALAEHGIDAETLEQVPLFAMIYELGRSDERHLAELRATARNFSADAQTATAAVA